MFQLGRWIFLLFLLGCAPQEKEQSSHRPESDTGQPTGEAFEGQDTEVEYLPLLADSTTGLSTHPETPDRFVAWPRQGRVSSDITTITYFIHESKESFPELRRWSVQLAILSSVVTGVPLRYLEVSDPSIANIVFQESYTSGCGNSLTLLGCTERHSWKQGEIKRLPSGEAVRRLRKAFVTIHVGVGRIFHLGDGYPIPSNAYHYASIAAHEFGHAVGMVHTHEKTCGAIDDCTEFSPMTPYLAKGTAQWLFNVQDMNLIASLYIGP